MAAGLAEVDPVWAWSSYEPDAKQPWTKSLAAHFFRRVGFGATTTELEAAVKESPAALAGRVITGGTHDDAFIRTMAEMSQTVIAGASPEHLPAWWLYRMLHTPDQAIEKLTLFWHGHFATSAAKVKDI